MSSPVPDLILLPAGTRVYYNRIEATPILWKDLEYYLPRINRYNSALDWSLAKHLALVTRMAKVTLRSELPQEQYLRILRWLAQHDFSEIYMVDLPTGLKAYCPDFRWIEKRFERHIMNQFGVSVTPEDLEIAKAIDKRACLLETWLFDSGRPLYQYLTEEAGLAPISGPEILLVEAVELMTQEKCLSELKTILGEPIEQSEHRVARA